MEALEAFKMTAGNFYLNDKSTGSVVGQQPFGGGRMSGKKIKTKNQRCFFKSIFSSGTNDKAGGPHYILRWASPQSIKETFVPLRDVNYPYMSN